jgi:hypothetical protein
LRRENPWRSFIYILSCTHLVDIIKGSYAMERMVKCRIEEDLTLTFFRLKYQDMMQEWEAGCSDF